MSTAPSNASGRSSVHKKPLDFGQALPDPSDPPSAEALAPKERLSIWRRLRRVLVVAPRSLADTSLFHKLSLIPFLAWVGLGADGLSSSAYGPEDHAGFPILAKIASGTWKPCGVHNGQIRDVERDAEGNVYGRESETRQGFLR